MTTDDARAALEEVCGDVHDLQAQKATLSAALDELERLQAIFLPLGVRTGSVSAEEWHAKTDAFIAALQKSRDAGWAEAHRLEAALEQVEVQVSSNENEPTSVLACIGRIAREALGRKNG